MIRLEVTGETPKEVLGQLAGLTEGFMRVTGIVEQAATGEGGEPPKRGRGRGKAAEDKPQISTNPEDRRGPEDDAATQAQDKADEKAETAAVKEETKKLTHDDVRTALGKYVKAYGMEAAQEDGPKLIALVCGEGKAKISDIPDDQAVFAKVIAGVDEMIQKNPYKRDVAL